MQIGQLYHFGLANLANYANEAAYREDTRRWSNGQIFTDILTKCAHTRPHRDWCGYWQGKPAARSVWPPGSPQVRSQPRSPSASPTTCATPLPAERRNTPRVVF